MSQLYATPQEAYAAYRDAPNYFFERYHEEHFDERSLISPRWTWAWTKYHYNLVENGIIDLLGALDEPTGAGDVLDVGSGTGHWIDFYAETLDARTVVATDFSKIAVAALTVRYAGREDVCVHRLDVCEPRDEFEGAFDVINAIGVMFHIVEDDRWRAALANFARYLRPDGIAVVGGDFGPRTEELGVMRRVRSIDLWESTLAELGLEVTGVRRFDWAKGGVNDGLKNNLLAFRHAR
jgi:SAM-dependent methyltransferase